ncbi:MAG: tRNA dihydrouridine synthase DusB [Gemmataceae bacterium]|nr:tRNA dihydrouridine synthase DusB [Gemmataceae bacterium]MCI0739177.1 tRNA dihydrouridine synthase DusB [Gemmataceae bacterium]
MTLQPQPLYFGPLRLESRYLLSPLAGYTNWPFRRAVRDLGGLGLATTDLVNARALVNRSPKTLELIDTCPDDRPLAVQIFGSVPEEMRDAAQWLEGYGIQAIDINMGCPVHKVTKSGGGSAMMCSPSATIDLVRQVVDAVTIPVTVKMRLGWDDADLSAPNFARAFEQVGVAAVMIHGRTRAQGFSGQVNHAGIRAVVDAVERIPIIGNGDIRTPADAERMFEETGCAGISIGRGALLNPWIFAQLVKGELGTDRASPMTCPGYEDRLDFMARHFDLLLKQRGERHACLTFRKMAAWYTRDLKPGREVHCQLVMLERAQEFEDIVARLRDLGPPVSWQRDVLPEIAVPKGPISHW